MRRLLFALAFLPSLAFAQTQIITLRYNSGTGFFVSPEGYVLTNAHVVKGCIDQYSLYTPYAIIRAELVAQDKEHDLALLKSEMPPKMFGSFRSFDISPAIGEKVAILGYPEEAVKKRQPVLKMSKLLTLGGPNDEREFIQFESTMKHGNSGGPLLDASGNIIGVVSAKSKVTAINTETRAVKYVQYADVAVAPLTVQRFLNDEDVRYQEAMPDKPLSSQAIAKKAGEFVVNVRCRID